MVSDFLYDETADIAVNNGDFAIGISDEQHVDDILISHKGHFKQYPLSGVGIIDFLDSPLTLNERDNLKRQISLQLEADGVRRAQIVMDGTGKVTIKGNYQ